MSMDEGTVVRFDYVLKFDGAVKEASTEEAAKKHGLFVEDRTYEPLTFAVGGRQIIPGLEKYVVDHKAGDTFSAVIPAAEAYGDRDPAKIQTIPMAQFKKQGVAPQVGQILNWNQQRVTITHVGGGRVRVDGNHELAGKDLDYEVTITDVLTSDADKLDAVLKMFFPEGAEHEYDGKEVTIQVPDQAKFSQEWPMMKFRVLTQVRQTIGLDKPVNLVERYPAMNNEAPVAEEE